MDSRHCKMRMNVEEGDRLSNLPDDLLHKILSFIDIRDAIGTNVLSSRWRFLWTSMSYLNFSTDDFSKLAKFSRFVTHFLSHCDNLTEVYSMKLNYRGKVSAASVHRLLDYAFSHNIQQLNVTCQPIGNDIDFPLSVFNSQSLKHLSLKIIGRTHGSYLTPTWEVPTLTTLDLHSVTLGVEEADKCISILSKCANLKNLTIKQFDIKGSNCFSITHPQLSNLALENGSYSLKAVNVVAPQLKNLTVTSCNGAKHVMISAPDLVSLIYKGSNLLELSTDGFHSLEKADICVPCPQKEEAHKIICLLEHLHSVHFLTLNMEIVELLSSSAELLLHQPSPFLNLKSLKIYPARVYLSGQAPVSDEIKSYLLDNSPGSTFTMVFREEIQAQNIMAELGVILEKEMDNTKTNSMLKIGGNMAQIKSCWDDLGVQIEKATVIISKLQDLDELLTPLPASKRAKLQPCFSGLCAKADIVISQVTDCMKIRCDENQSLSSDFFQTNLIQYWSGFLSKLSVLDTCK